MMMARIIRGSSAIRRSVAGAPITSWNLSLAGVVKPMYHQFIEPTKRYADVIIPEGVNQYGCDATDHSQDWKKSSTKRVRENKIGRRGKSISNSFTIVGNNWICRSGLVRLFIHAKKTRKEFSINLQGWYEECCVTFCTLPSFSREWKWKGSFIAQEDQALRLFVDHVITGFSRCLPLYLGWTVLTTDRPPDTTDYLIQLLLSVESNRQSQS